MLAPFVLSRRLPLVLAVFALPLLAAAACGGDDDGGSSNGDDGTPPAAASTQAGGGAYDTKTSPIVVAPASLYSILLEDVGTANFITDIRGTVELFVENYAESAVFKTPAEGVGLLKRWGYQGGYQTAMTPEGREPAILNGAFVIKVETHVFKTVESAQEAFDYFTEVIRKNGISQAVTAPAVGNTSYYARAVSGKIGGSNVSQALHQVIFRRGNMVAIVLTIGAEPLMKVDTVREMALIVDSKALGMTPVIEPTPTRNFTPPPGSRATPTAVATR